MSKPDSIENISQYILDYSSILDTTVKDIKSFLLEVSKVYSFIAEKFPVIEQEMKSENEKANNLLSYFNNVDENDKSFAKDLAENQSDFTKSFDRFQDLLNQDNELSNSIVEDVDKISEIINSIEQIRKLADQIKVYSLNAIIISSKHGSGGKAFGEISKNIIKMSENSNNQANQMNKLGYELFNKFESFKTEIITTNNNQKDNFAKMKEKLYKEHSNMVDSFSTFADMISDIIQRVDNSCDIIFDIMMMLPREDIVRQQTEHIISSIESIITENKDFIDMYSEHIENNTNQNEVLEHRLLDLLTFDELVLTLIIENFKSIYEEINNTNNFIYNSLKNLKDTLSEITLDRNTIVEYMIGNDNRKSGFPFTVSDSLFNEYINFIKLYLSNFKLFLDTKYRIYDNNISIIDSIEDLENMFLETKNIGKAFNSINFLAKIELEKKANIFENSKIFSVENIESIATNITETVDSCLEQFQTIKVEIFNSISKFKSNISKQSTEHSFIEAMTEDVHKRLDDSKSIINSNIKILETHAKEVFVLIDKSLIDLSSLTTLLTKITEITEIFEKIKSVIKEKKEEAYKNLGVENWKIESDKYLEIVNSYTIKKEREIANSILSGESVLNDDISIEEGSDSGDFTLF